MENNQTEIEKNTLYLPQPLQADISKKLLFFNSLLVLLIGWMVFLIYDTSYKTPIQAEEMVREPVVHPEVFDNLTLEAKSAYVFDVAKNKVMFEKNKSAQLPLASLTKLTMALTATNLLEWDSRITIKKEFLNVNIFSDNKKGTKNNIKQ